MKVEISVPEVVAIFKEIQAQPEKIFEMIRVDVREGINSGYRFCHFVILASHDVSKEMIE